MDNNSAGNLEEKFHDAIQRICETEADTDSCKEYFSNMTINDLINDALEE